MPKIKGKDANGYFYVNKHVKILKLEWEICSRAESTKRRATKYDKGTRQSIYNKTQKN